MSRNIMSPWIVRLLVVGVAISTISCSRPPSDSDLQEYLRAQNLVDSYKGQGTSLKQAAHIVKGLLKRRPDLPHAYVAQARLAMYGIEQDVDPTDSWLDEYVRALSHE